LIGRKQRLVKSYPCPIHVIAVEKLGCFGFCSRQFPGTFRLGSFLGASPFSFP